MENSNTTPSTDSLDEEEKSLTSQYWHHLLTKGKRPTSVYAFTQSIGLAEAEFYKIASNFETLEAQYWRSLVDETVNVLQEDEDYIGYTSEQKILAFFYTFFVHAQRHRSRLVLYFPRMGCLSSLKQMRESFVHFAKQVIEQGVTEGAIANRKKLTDKYPQLLFEQLRGIIEFHRNDNSAEFQDTDALIEKSVRFGADIASAGTLDSAFDLGRFLLRKITIPNK